MDDSFITRTKKTKTKKPNCFVLSTWVSAVWQLTVLHELRITIPFCDAIAIRSSFELRRTHLSSSPGT